MLLNEFVIPNLSQIYFVYQKSLKATSLIGFWVQNNTFNLCARVVNSQRLFCSKKLEWNVLHILNIGFKYNLVCILNTHVKTIPGNLIFHFCTRNSRKLLLNIAVHLFRNNYFMTGLILAILVTLYYS